MEWNDTEVISSLFLIKSSVRTYTLYNGIFPEQLIMDKGIFVGKYH